MSMKKIFLPSCRECKGLLSFKIQPINFTIEFECENDRNHNKNNIYFKTFERFYLKEKDILQCSTCKINLENSEYFNCDICKNNFCCKCFIEDIQMNGHKNIINNNYYNHNNKCLIHHYEFIEYCLNCKTNICILCIKKGNHKNHNTKSYIDLMPSLENIEHLKNKLEVKSNILNKLIEKIIKWKKQIDKKVEELKQNLKNEISLLKKLIFNYNNSFRNYIYYKNFIYINKFIKNEINNENLLELYNCENFEKQTNILIKIFKNLGRKNKENDDNITKAIGNINSIKYLNYQLVERINNNFFIFYDFDRALHLSYYDEPKNTIFSSNRIELNFYIYSISLSTIENKIFICLLYDKKIKQIDYNLEKKVMILNQKEIVYNSITNINHFYKCIQLSTKLIATSDDNNIIIWLDNVNNFLQKMIISLNANIFDLLLIDNNNFISSQTDKKSLTIYNIYNLKEVKKIKNIDCINNSNSLFKIGGKYIIINCHNGIGLLLIKTKEIVQYFQKYSFVNRQKITCDDEGNIYILNIEEFKNNSNSLLANNFNYNCRTQIIVANIVDNSIMIFKEYEKFDFNENKLEITCLNKRNLILWGRNSYLFQDKN